MTTLTQEEVAVILSKLADVAISRLLTEMDKAEYGSVQQLLQIVASSAQLIGMLTKSGER